MNLPTSKIGWRTREDGVILTWDLPNGPERAPMLAPELRNGFDIVNEKWGPSCREISAGLASPTFMPAPDGVCQVHIWRESGGNPRAFRKEPTTPTEWTPLTGIGLGQITSHELKGRHRVKATNPNLGLNEYGEQAYYWVGGYSDEQLFEPRLNLMVTIKHLGRLWALYGGDFARVSAAYNAGSPRQSTKNDWGMVMTTGHVSAEVAAFNYWLSQKMNAAEKEAALAVAHQFTLFDLLPARGPLDTLPDGDEPA